MAKRTHVVTLREREHVLPNMCLVLKRQYIYITINQFYDPMFLELTWSVIYIFKKLEKTLHLLLQNHYRLGLGYLLYTIVKRIQYIPCTIWK